MSETKWLNTNINLSYKDVFNIVKNNIVLKSVLNPDKLIEASFSVATSLFVQQNNGNSPYDTTMTTNSIHYLKGDATDPQGSGKKIIAHVCNDVGAWGAGFVLAISKKWKKPEISYKELYKHNHDDCSLGNIMFVPVEDDIVVANMIGQRGIFSHFDPDTETSTPPIRYNALEVCLKALADEALKTKASIHLPKIGAGLAGGDWNIIEKLIIEQLVNKGIETYVYLWDD